MEVVFIGEGRVFSLERARGLVPIIRKIYKENSGIVDHLNLELDHLVHQLHGLDPGEREIIVELEVQITELKEKKDECIQSWNIKIRKLGAFPGGRWIVDFDSGDGYFCWKCSTESTVSYWHGYSEGFSNRVSVKQWGTSIKRGSIDTRQVKDRRVQGSL